MQNKKKQATAGNAGGLTLGGHPLHLLTLLLPLPNTAAGAAEKGGREERWRDGCLLPHTRHPGTTPPAPPHPHTLPPSGSCSSGDERRRRGREVNDPTPQHPPPPYPPPRGCRETKEEGVGGKKAAEGLHCVGADRSGAAAGRAGAERPVACHGAHDGKVEGRRLGRGRAATGPLRGREGPERAATGPLKGRRQGRRRAATRPRKGGDGAAKRPRGA
ncbi:unnamed protein product [Closterium sp. NIES-53]